MGCSSVRIIIKSSSSSHTDEHEYGRKVPDTLCDWTFLSSDSAEGDLYTPDHMISPGTTCLYTFTGQPGEVLEVTVKAYELK